MHNLTRASEGFFEQEVGWFGMFSSQYRKGIPNFI